MTALIEQFHIDLPVVRAMLGLLPHLTPPVVLKPAPNSPLPRGCLHLPSMRLVVTGAAGAVVPALGAAEAVARAMYADVLVVSIRPNHATRALRYDVLFVEQDRTEHVSDLLFWTLPDQMPALIPMAHGAPAAIIGKTTLIPSDAMPFRDAAERAAGVARGVSEQRLALWGEE